MIDKIYKILGMAAIGCGGILWVTSIYFQGNANAEAIAEVKLSIERKDERIYEELRRLNDKIDLLITQRRAK